MRASAAPRRGGVMPPPRTTTSPQRVVAVGCVLAALGPGAAWAGSSSAAPDRSRSVTRPALTPTSTPTPTATLAELPRGGRNVFPAYRLGGVAGAPGSPRPGGPRG